MGSIQRGGMVCKNDNGTLERVDGTSTYIGSATLPSGKVITKRFRCANHDEEELKSRWLKWQGRNSLKPNGDDGKEKQAEEEKPMEKTIACPFSGKECGIECPLFSEGNMTCSLKLGGIGLYNMCCNFGKLGIGEELELIALAIAESKQAHAKPEPEESTKTAEQGVDAYLKDKTFLAFVNLHSKTVYSPYRKFCEAEGFPAASEAEFANVVGQMFPELKRQKAHGGCTFVAA